MSRKNGHVPPDRQPLTIQPDWLEQELSYPELLILARLDSYWRNGHSAHPSDQFIAQQTNLTIRTVQRAIASLADHGWIVRQTEGRREGSGGQRRFLLPTEKVHPGTAISWGVAATRGGGFPPHAAGGFPPPVAEESKRGRIREENNQCAAHTGEQYFDRFWQTYPTIRRREKKRAREIWKRKKLDSRAEDIIADVERRKTRDPQWTKDGGQYIPMPTTYLNGERWEDELPPDPGSGPEDPRKLPPDEEGRAPWLPNGKPNPEYRGGTYWP